MCGVRCAPPCPVNHTPPTFVSLAHFTSAHIIIIIRCYIRVVRMYESYISYATVKSQSSTKYVIPKQRKEEEEGE